jgi:hypothetical protein
MDDLGVIRLVAMDNISRKRIARGGDGSEGKVLEMSGGLGESPLLTLLQVFPQSLRSVFGEKHLSWEKDAEGEDSR